MSPEEVRKNLHHQNRWVRSKQEEKEIKAESAPSSQNSEEIKNKEVAESSTQETADK